MHICQADDIIEVKVSRNSPVSARRERREQDVPSMASFQGMS
jgi:hypothetical protein